MIIYALIPFAVIGWAFIILLIAGLLINGRQCAIALDQFIGTCIITGAMADETISAWAHRRHHKRTEQLINWIFQDQQHCAKAYISEMRGIQTAPDYRKD
jgi:hypothetical protein